MRRRGAVLLAAGAAGLLVGIVVALASQDVYRATALLVVRTPTPSTEGEEPPPAQVVAATYAELVASRSFLEQIRPQVAGGRLSADDLSERVDATRPAGTALVRLTAEGPTREEARGLATDVAGAFVASVQQQASQRAAQVEDELRRRLEGASEQERAALQAELAAQAARAVESGTSAALPAPPAAEPDPVGPSVWLGALAGLLVGLAAGAAAMLVPRRRPKPRLVEPAAGSVLTGVVRLRSDPEDARFEHSRDGATWSTATADWDTAALPEGRYLLRVEGGAPVPVQVDNAAPAVTLASPAAGARVSGVVRLSADARDEGSGVRDVRFLVSDGSPEWQPLGADEWDTTGLGPGTYWLSAVATDRAGHSAASDPQAVVVG